MTSLGPIRPEPMVHVAYAGRSNADVPPAVQAARNAASARSTVAASAAATTTSMGGGRSGAGAGIAGRSSTGSMGSSGSSTVTSTGRTFAASATAAAAQPLAPANGGGSETTRPTVATENRNFQATFDYSPQGPKEMQLTKNDLVTVLDRSHKEWWKVQRGMKKGMVPANYLKPV